MEGGSPLYFQKKPTTSHGKIKMFWIKIIAVGIVFLGNVLLLYYALNSATKKNSLIDYQEHINS